MKVHFTDRSAFHDDLNRRVDAWFEREGRSRHGGWRMAAKSAVLLAWLPRVCHLHYPALAAIVEETCRAHRVRYRCEPTLRSALAANFAWLHRMGLPLCLEVS